MRFTHCNHPEYTEALKVRKYQIARDMERNRGKHGVLEQITDAAYVLTSHRMFYPMSNLPTVNHLEFDGVLIRWWSMQGAVRRLWKTHQED